MPKLPQRVVHSIKKNGVGKTAKLAGSVLSTKVQYGLIGPVINSTVYKGVEINLNSAGISGQMQRRFYDNEYESREVECVDKYLDPSIDVIELGGCTGFLSCYISNRQSEGVMTVCVEANPFMMSVITNHSQLNGCDIEMVAGAYDPYGDPVELSLPTAAWSASAYQKTGRSVTVSGISLDLLQTEFDLDSFALVVDIEGAEIELIENELEILERRCELLVVEIHDEDGGMPELADRAAGARQLLADSSFQHIEDEDGVEVYRNTDLALL
jgi:FkbM family methyltransferase